jgi:hypothetical protein
MKKHPARIGVPTNPTLLILLAVAIKLQHDKLIKEGKPSPLSGLKWEELGPVIDEAAAADKELTDLDKEIEKLTERRKILAEGALVEFVRSSRDVLTGIFRGELHKMIDFGFEVADTPKAKKTTAEKKAA